MLGPTLEIQVVVFFFPIELALQDFMLGVFDVFESESIGTDKRSIGIYVLYQGQNKTLSDDKVNKIHQRLCDQLQTALPLQIR